MTTRLGAREFESLCRLGIAVLIAGLPLLCLAYCEAAVSAPLDWRARIAHHHHPAMPQDKHEPLLDALQALLRATVECLPTGDGWCAALSMTTLSVAHLPKLTRTNPRPPVPPPRRA